MSFNFNFYNNQKNYNFLSFILTIWTQDLQMLIETYIFYVKRLLIVEEPYDVFLTQMLPKSLEQFICKN